ncbi:MAG TPA: rhomboid family intramembrane serine protease [Planctomycetaceae bacterium]|nr:rhomboid family intramembrane serine protease [Planctomycetaceae bacterium]
MIPLRDNIPSRTTPFVTYAVIAACAVVFFLQLGDERREEAGQPTITEQYSMIPARVTKPREPVEIPVDVELRHTRDGRVEQVLIRRPAAPPPIPAWLTLVTSMFLHGGWLHFIGNMWFLYIFGDNVEDRFGHVGYLLFYLLTGLVASLAHYATDPLSAVPSLGASGAIAGVMGGYLVLYPRAMVLTLVPIFFFIQIVVVPAAFFLIVWFAIQFFQGTLAITAMQQEGGGVAFWAHIGGFVAGVLGAGAGRLFGLVREPVTQRLPNADHMTHYRVRPRRGLFG